MRRMITTIVIAVFAVFCLAGLAGANQNQDDSDLLAKKMEENLQKGDTVEMTVQKAHKIVKKNRVKSHVRTMNFDGYGF